MRTFILNFSSYPHSSDIINPLTSIIIGHCYFIADVIYDDYYQ